MKSALAVKPMVPIPEPRRSNRRDGKEEAKNRAGLMRRTMPAGRSRFSGLVAVVARWLEPGGVATLTAPNAQEIEALEGHVRKYMEKHRFTSFPC